MNACRFGLTAFVLFLASWPVWGQDADEDARAVFPLRPAAAPDPALKFRLLPERERLEPGNAAIYYHRAILVLAELQHADQSNRAMDPSKAIEVQVSEWINGPLAEIPIEDARQLLDRCENVLREVELGAHQRACDWQLEGRVEGPRLLLPEIQRTRSLARLVSLRARVAIREGKTDEAMNWIQVNLALGRHLGADSTIIIQSLVGAAITGVSLKDTRELIQAPGTPSLYWALANRPRPFVPMGGAILYEMSVIERELPELSRLDQGIWSQDEARRFGDELMAKLAELMGPQQPKPSSNLQQAGQRLALSGMLSSIYPEAKKALIAEGRPEAEVEAMPALQASSLYVVRQHLRQRDDAAKWLGLPYWQSYNRIDETEYVGGGHVSKTPISILFNLLLPAVNSARMAEVRVERDLDALQCVEGIRLYASAHKGALPESLEDLVDSPAPMDPATGKAFDYEKRDANTAFLSTPLIPGGPDHPAFRVRYELKLTR